MEVSTSSVDHRCKSYLKVEIKIELKRKLHTSVKNVANLQWGQI